MGKRQKAITQLMENNHTEAISTLESKVTQANACNINTLIHVNELLQYMTSLDYVKMMIKDAANQAELVQGVASGSEELSASTEDISSHVQRANRTMNETVEETTQHLKKIDGAFLNSEDKIDQMDNVKLTMDDVTQETQKINDIIKVIKDVADQTNLLALNASIEAARSGEHGRGFTVVAEEIKKLAERTRKEVSVINDIVASLNTKVTKTSREIDNVVLSLSDSKMAMNEATSGMENIREALRSVDDNITEISANIEEQTAATQQMTSSLMIINEKSFALMNEADRTGKAFYDISQKIDEIRLSAFKSISEIDPSTMIEITITDHLMWKWKIYNMILGYIHLDMDNLGDHHVCRLGKWINSIDTSDSRVSMLVNRIDIPHSQLHENAKKAVLAYDRKQVAESEQYLRKIEENSSDVVKYLNELKRVMVSI